MNIFLYACVKENEKAAIHTVLLYRFKNCSSDICAPINFWVQQIWTAEINIDFRYYLFRVCVCVRESLMFLLTEYKAPVSRFRLIVTYFQLKFYPFQAYTVCYIHFTSICHFVHSIKLLIHVKMLIHLNSLHLSLRSIQMRFKLTLSHDIFMFNQLMNVKKKQCNYLIRFHKIKRHQTKRIENLQFNKTVFFL